MKFMTLNASFKVLQVRTLLNQIRQIVCVSRIIILTPEYIQKAILETMKKEIEYGDFCDILLDKFDGRSELT